MKTKAIKITKQEAQELREMGELGKKLAEASGWIKEPKYPMELVGGYRVFNNGIFDEKSTTFLDLVETCKKWNEIDGFVADWSEGSQQKAAIVNSVNKAGIYWCFSTSRPLQFKTKETAELFLNTFKKEIELAKDLI